MVDKIRFYTPKDYERIKRKVNNDWLAVAATIVTLQQIKGGLEGYSNEKIKELEDRARKAGLNPGKIRPQR